MDFRNYPGSNKKKFDVQLSPVSVWRTLKVLRLTPQRPLRRAYQQDSGAVKKILNEEKAGKTI
jgi:hypothetical protein